MAQSRLEKIGTIFSRVNGLLRSNGMKPEDKPIWFDVYETFPPKLEPRFDRPAPTSRTIRKVFYEEDIVRAKLHKSSKQLEIVSLLNEKHKTPTQQFIKIYQNLKSQGALNEENIFEAAAAILQQQREDKKSSRQQVILENAESDNTEIPLPEAGSAFKEESLFRHNNIEDKQQKPVFKNSIGGIDIKNLFKD